MLIQPLQFCPIAVPVRRLHYTTWFTIHQQVNPDSRRRLRFMLALMLPALCKQWGLLTNKPE